MKDVKLKVEEELYEFYRQLGLLMQSSPEEMMEMMLRVCESRLKKKWEENSRQ